MKKKILSFLAFASVMIITAQNGMRSNTQNTQNYKGNVGINTNTPQAALDIKSVQNDGAKVLRFSTPPATVDKKKEYVLFAGEKVGDGYNLRKINAEDLFNIIGVYVPSSKRIVVVNTTKQTLNQKGVSVDLKLDKEVYNSGSGDYVLDASTGEVEIKKDGYYDVVSWVGFEKIPVYDGDIIVSVAKKSATESDFANYKRSIISRLGANLAEYSVGNGVGASFTFVEKFKAGDKLKLRATLEVYHQSINTLPGSLSLTITRVDREYINVVTP